MKRIQMTLAFCVRENEVLLALKKRGFGAGRWNGYGGKVEARETLEEATKREMREESGIEILQMEERVVHEFAFQKNPNEVLEVHTFWVSRWQGEPQETEEMSPQWFAFADIPFADMWADDQHWLPLFLEGKTLATKFVFGDNDEVLEKHIEVH